MYSSTFKNEEILFLRQVDDFAVATKLESAAMNLIKEIDSHMAVGIKDLGHLTQ